MNGKNLTSLAAGLALITACIVSLLGYRGPALAAWSVLMVVAAVVSALRRAARARQRARDHRRVEAGAAATLLSLGPCVIEGRVAYAEGADTAMRIDFEQAGTEKESSGSWSHAWTETHRKLTVRPFYLVRSDDTRIRVEPTSEQSQLFDELEAKILVPVHATTTPTRIRFATLLPGERVWVTGSLNRSVDPEQAGGTAAGYRHAALSWVLRGRPLIVSSVSLAAHFAARARQHLIHAFVWFALLFLPSIMLARYLDRVQGATVVARVDSVREQTDEDHNVKGYRARATYEGIRLETDTLNWAPLEGTPLSFRIGAYSHNAGPTPRFSDDEAMLSFAIALVVVGMGCVLQQRSARTLPWYRSDRVKVTERGTGRLSG